MEKKKMRFNDVCMICHDNSLSFIENKLNYLINRLPYDIDKEVNDYDWHIRVDCRYGLPQCHKQNPNNAKRLADIAGRKMNAYLHSGDTDKTHLILDCLRGEFSQVYCDFERRLYKQKRDC